MYDENVRDLAEDEGSLALMQEVYRSSRYPIHMRMKAAQAALPFEYPKLSVSVSAVGFGGQMESLMRDGGRSTVIGRSVIDAEPIPATIRSGPTIEPAEGTSKEP
jgi:hypothetical protein